MNLMQSQLNQLQYKKIREERFKHEDFYVVQPTSPESTPLSFPGLRISLSKPPRLQMLTVDFQGVNDFYNKRLSPISQPKCIPTLTITQNKRLQIVFLSHNI